MSGSVSSGSSPWVLSTMEGGCHFRWRRARGEVFAEWVGILSIRIDPAGRVVHEAAPGADPRVVQKLVHTGAVAFVRALREQPSFHGSSVTRSGLAIVCLGEKGSGKSTAASELCRADGFELLADDVAALDGSSRRWRVLPTESAHWLAVHSGPGKAPVPAPLAAGRPADLTSMVTLRFDDRALSPQATRLRGAAAYAALSAAFLRFEAADALRVGELDVLSSIAAQARVFELVRARSCSAGATARLLMQLMEGSP
jgi:hypothetical protein